MDCGCSILAAMPGVKSRAAPAGPDTPVTVYFPELSNLFIRVAFRSHTCHLLFTCAH
ncbi:protein of unknown function [Kyrpidia spormannii]|uniref:Uncharacterized protein n=2 Tax=Kyrpidia spormannii TaxID=2055160 RepID=A0ACA8Z7B9_9BACL|nr:protein of unknown function [Kyrpidia spormannii]CAB3391640.1 protein of unknown function [Kyrpidia spormannii]